MEYHPAAPLRAGSKHIIKSLFILPYLKAAGTERVNIDIIQGLDRKRFLPRLFLIEDDIRLWDQPLPELDIRTALRARESKLKFYKWLPRLLGEAQQADVIVGGMELTSTYLAAIAGTLLNLPTIGWVHMDFDRFVPEHAALHRRLVRLLYPRLNRVVAVSEGVAESILHLVPAIKNQLEVINNSIDIEAVVAKAAQGEHYSAQVPVVAAVGRLERQKGFDILIEAHARLIKSGCHHELLIIGEGSERQALHRLAAERGVGETVVLPGFKANPYGYIQSADIFALSSRFEGMPIVILEAMALGKPIAAADCRSGPAELLGDRGCGILVPVEDADEMAKALGRLLEDRDYSARLGMQARQRVELFSKTNMLRQIETMMVNLVEGFEGRSI